MSFHNNVAGEAESILQHERARANNAENPPSVFDADDSQYPMDDRVLVRRARRISTRHEPDGTIRTVQSAVYDLSSDTTVLRMSESEDETDRLIHFRPVFTGTSRSLVRPPFQASQPHDSTSLAPYNQQPCTFLELKSSVTDVGKEPTYLNRPEFRHTWRRFVCIVGLSAANLMCGFSVTSSSTALVTIKHGFSSTTVKPFWIPGSELLIGALFQPLLMRLSYVTGCKLLIIIGLLVFTSMSLVSALSGGSMVQLIVSRSIAGIGFASVRTLTPLILAQLVDYNSKKWYEAWPSQSFWLGACAGPLTGSIIVEYLKWQQLFWVEGAVGIWSLALLSFLELRQIEGAAWRLDLAKINYLGWALFSIATTTTAVALSQINLIKMLTSWWILAESLAAFFPVIVWCCHIGRTGEPIVPVSIFRDHRATASCIITFVQNLTFTCLVHLIPVYLGVVRDLGLVDCGLQASSWTLPMFFASVFVTHNLRARTSSTPSILLISMYLSGLAWLGIAIGLGHTAVLVRSGTRNLATLGALVTGLGLGTLTPALCTILQIATTNDDETIHVLPLYNFVGSLGLCFGIVTGGAIFLH